MYDVIFFTPEETGSAMLNSTHISLLKGMVHCGEWVECMGVASGFGHIGMSLICS